MIKFSNSLFSLILILNIVDCARILVVLPTSCKSHHQVFRPIIKTLLDRRHELVVITAFPEYEKDRAPKNLTEIDIQEVTLTAWAEAMVDMTEDNSIYNQGKKMVEFLITISEKQLNTKVVLDLLNNEEEKFDLVIGENYVKPFFYLSYKYKTPLILLSSLYIHYGELIGIQIHPMLFPEYSRRKLNNLTVTDTITELYNDLIIRRLIWSLDSQIDTFLKKNDSCSPSIQSLHDRIALMFGNVHDIWNFNTPIPPTAIHLYGIHKKLPTKLPEDIQTYLDSSTHGAIYLSFGTTVSESQLPNYKIQSMLKVFSELPYNVLFKWDAENIPGKPKNVLVRKWFQQADILRHPKIKLFITQAGINSIDEAIVAGVPLLTIPIAFDQFRNAQKIERFGMGRQLDISTMTENEFRDAVQRVIDDESYRRNTEKIRNLFHDQPQGPLERMVWWTEYVIRHNGAYHLRCPAANMPWTEYFEVELILGIFSFVLVIVIVIFITVKRFLLYVLNVFKGDKVKRY